MKLEVCSFSGFKIPANHGRWYVRVDGRTFYFLSSKSENLFHNKKSPRQIAWTAPYRRKHKKGITEEVAKKRTRRAVKFTRGIEGASFDVIQAKRSETSEVRKAAREQAVRSAKEAAKKKKEIKKTTKTASAKTKAAPQPKVANKNPKTKAPQVGGKK